MGAWLIDSTSAAGCAAGPEAGRSTGAPTVSDWPTYNTVRARTARADSGTRFTPPCTPGCCAYQVYIAWQGTGTREAMKTQTQASLALNLPQRERLRAAAFNIPGAARSTATLDERRRSHRRIHRTVH